MKKFFGNIIDTLLSPLSALMMLPMITDGWSTEIKSDTENTEKTNFGEDDQTFEIIELKKEDK